LTPPPRPCMGDMVTLITRVAATRTVGTALLGRPCRGSGAAPTSSGRVPRRLPPASGPPPGGLLPQRARRGRNCSGTDRAFGPHRVPEESRVPDVKVRAFACLCVGEDDRPTQPARPHDAALDGGSTRWPDRVRGEPRGRLRSACPHSIPRLYGDSAFSLRLGGAVPVELQARGVEQTWSREGLNGDRQHSTSSRQQQK
jgi:hypothetical protein